jgi:hypothetical protein
MTTAVPVSIVGALRCSVAALEAKATTPVTTVATAQTATIKAAEKTARTLLVGIIGLSFAPSPILRKVSRKSIAQQHQRPSISRAVTVRGFCAPTRRWRYLQARRFAV